MRYMEIPNEKREWMVIDTKTFPHKVLCTCTGYDAFFNAKEIIQALEFQHNHMREWIGIDSTTLTT